MRRAVLAGVAMVALSGSDPARAEDVSPPGDITARGLKPSFDAFAATHFDNPHFAGPPPLRSRDCEDARPVQSYTCHYTFGTVVDVAAETEPGSDRLAKVTLTWDGTDRRRDLFAQAAGDLFGTLSPGSAEPAWGDVSWAILSDLPRPPYTFAPREWRAGGWAYRFWHDGRYGARDSVIFEAARSPLP